METLQRRKPYQPPELRLYHYEVEHGFDESYRVTQIDNVSEIQSQTEGDNYENYHGEWF